MTESTAGMLVDAWRSVNSAMLVALLGPLPYVAGAALYYLRGETHVGPRVIASSVLVWALSTFVYAGSWFVKGYHQSGQDEGVAAMLYVPICALALLAALACIGFILVKFHEFWPIAAAVLSVPLMYAWGAADRAVYEFERSPAGERHARAKERSLHPLLEAIAAGDAARAEQAATTAPEYELTIHDDRMARTCEILIERGVDPNRKVTWFTLDPSKYPAGEQRVEKTPLDFALDASRAEVAAVLAKHGGKRAAELGPAN
jgi:hypothetical protein